MEAACELGHSTATDLADWLVRTLGVPFRQAHGLAGAAVKRADELGVSLGDLPIEALTRIEPRITADVYAVLTPRASLAARDSYGGAAPSRVRDQIERWKERLG